MHVGYTSQLTLSAFLSERGEVVKRPKPNQVNELYQPDFNHQIYVNLKRRRGNLTHFNPCTGQISQLTFSASVTKQGRGVKRPRPDQGDAERNQSGSSHQSDANNNAGSGSCKLTIEPLWDDPAAPGAPKSKNVSEKGSEVWS